MTDLSEQSTVEPSLSTDDGVSDGTTEREVAAPRPVEQQEVSPYDFNSPKHVNKEWVNILEDIHKGMARRLAGSLSDLLNSVVEVRVADVEQVTYGEFIHSLPNPTCFNLLKSASFPGCLCLDISPLIVYPIIDPSTSATTNPEGNSEKIVRKNPSG